jgi:hypothetical protein
MGEQLSVLEKCTGLERDQPDPSLKKARIRRKNTTNSSNNRLRPSELVSYSQMSTGVERDRQQTTTRAFVPVETRISNEKMTSDFEARVEKARQTYRLSVGKAHTEEDEPNIIGTHVEQAKVSFCEKLERLKEEAAAKCMFATAQAIKEEIYKVQEKGDSPSRVQRRQDVVGVYSSAPTTPAMLSKVLEKKPQEKPTPELHVKLQSATESAIPVPLESQAIQAVNTLGTEPQQEDHWLHQEEHRRKANFAREMNQRIIEKQETRSMLGNLLANNRLKKSQLSRPDRSSAEVSSPISPMLVTSSPNNGRSDQLNKLLQRQHIS